MTFTVEVTVPDVVYRTLVETAQQTGQPVEVVASEWLRVAAQHQMYDPLDAFIGSIDGEGTDWADNHDTYIGQGHLTSAGRAQE